MARPETPKMSEATTDTLMQASSSSFSTRFFSAVRTPDQGFGPIPGQVSQPPDVGGWHEAWAAASAAQASLHSHTASKRSVFGRPGRCLTSLALTSHGSSP